MPTLAAMARRGAPYRGVLYAGLMLTPEGETGRIQCPLRRSGMPGADAAAGLRPCAGAAGRGRRFAGGQSLDWHDEVAMTVVMAANGYPGSYDKGSVINGLDKVSGADVTVFHAGTARAEDGTVTATGGRVLNVTARGKTVAQAQANAYAGVDKIDWPQRFCRQDIGHREVAREQNK